MEVSGMDSSSSKINTGPDKTDSGLPDASAAMDSVSRVPNSPEEIHRVWSEKREHRCGETHAFSKACGNRLTAKTSRDDSCQDKLESPMSENDQRVQRVLRGKAEHRETAECCRYAGGQTSQKEDGTSEDMPLRLLLHRQKKLRKKCLLTNVPSTQSAEDEGQGLRDASDGPNSVGPTSPEKGLGRLFSFLAFFCLLGVWLIDSRSEVDLLEDRCLGVDFVSFCSYDWLELFVRFFALDLGS
ncbi:hypothetical protein Ancab_024483 [Ancistrocladus abbreviatus]